MTDIPGTSSDSKTSKVVIPEASSLPDVEKPPSEFQIVNIEEIKKGDPIPTKNTFFGEKEVWYNTLKGWIMIGLGFSVLFLVIGIWYHQFLLLTFFCPLISIASWYLKKFFTKFESHVDPLSK
jgi:hypothetical protein